MLSNFLLSFREGLEAALVVGIILMHLVKIDRNDLKKTVFAGVGAGFAVSLAIGILSFVTAKEMEGGSQEIFQGIMMLLSAGLIVYFILWLHRTQNTANHVKDALSKQATGFGLFILAFLSVFREGSELIIFNLTKISENATTVAFGSILGIVVAISVSIVIFKTSLKLNLSFIFKALGVLLILVGSELFSEGLVKLIGDVYSIDAIGFAVFFIPSVAILLSNDIKKVIKKLQPVKS